MPFCFQLRAKLDVVENLAVEDDPQRLVLVGDRLLSAAQVNDAQPGAAQPHALIAVNAELVRPAVANHRQHLTYVGFPDRRTG